MCSIICATGEPARDALILRVAFTPRAIRQLEHLHEYLSRASDRIADDYVGRIMAQCEKLSLFPQRGTLRDHVLPGLRTIGFERRATIAFMAEADRVVIEGVFHGGQDFEQALRGDDPEFPSPQDR